MVLFTNVEYLCLLKRLLFLTYNFKNICFIFEDEKLITLTIKKWLTFSFKESLWIMQNSKCYWKLIKKSELYERNSISKFQVTVT